jgi:hypothetical protein
MPYADVCCAQVRVWGHQQLCQGSGLRVEPLGEGAFMYGGLGQGSLSVVRAVDVAHVPSLMDGISSTSSRAISIVL